MTERLIEPYDEEMWTPFLEEVNSLMLEEKAARHENNATKGSELTKRIIQVCFDNKDWRRLNDLLKVLTKRRGQSQKAIGEMVKQAFEYLESTPDRKTKLELVQTITEVTEGKFYVEAEFARCKRINAEMVEADGDAEAASKIILDV